MLSKCCALVSHSPRYRCRLGTRLIARLAAVIVASVVPAVAQAQSVLVWSTGNSGGDTPGVAAWLQASGKFTSVTGIDSNSTMTLPQLLQYDRVFYFSSTSDGQDPVGIGNVLADYADSGRLLVLSTFAWALQGGNTLGGRIIGDQISPYVLKGGSLYTDVTIQSHDGSSFFDGVNSINGFFHDDVALNPGAVERGRWSDNSSLLATKGNVVAINLFPDDFWGSVSGDHRRLFINALAGIPEPSSLLLAGMPLAGCAVHRRRRQRTRDHAPQNE